MASTVSPSSSSSREVRFGILGCADIAKKNVRAIKSLTSVSVTAIGSRDLSKAKRFAEETGLLTTDVRLYGSYQAVLDDVHVDAVYIPLPTSLHMEWVEKATKKGKHILLEKPPALTVSDLETILSFCKEAGVQFMDGTMWMHNPRTSMMKEVLDDKAVFGELRRVNLSFFFYGDENFHKYDIRVKAGLDGLGCLGDVGWYCIRAALWANNFELPVKVLSQIDPKTNSEGVLMSCGATLVFANGSVAYFDCGFDSHWRQSLVIAGTLGIVHLDDFCIPNKEDVSVFSVSNHGGVSDFATKVTTVTTIQEAVLLISQEAAMVEAMAKCVRNIRDEGGNPDERWPDMSKATQIVMMAVLESIQNGCTPVLL